jgi:hypothetical protein
MTSGIGIYGRFLIYIGYAGCLLALVVGGDLLYPSLMSRFQVYQWLGDTFFGDELLMFIAVLVGFFVRLTGYKRL